MVSHKSILFILLSMLGSWFILDNWSGWSRDLYNDLWNKWNLKHSIYVTVFVLFIIGIGPYRKYLNTESDDDRYLNPKHTNQDTDIQGSSKDTSNEKDVESKLIMDRKVQEEVYGIYFGFKNVSEDKWKFICSLEGKYIHLMTELIDYCKSSDKRIKYFYWNDEYLLCSDNGSNKDQNSIMERERLMKGIRDKLTGSGWQDNKITFARYHDDNHNKVPYYAFRYEKEIKDQMEINAHLKSIESNFNCLNDLLRICTAKYQWDNDLKDIMDIPNRLESYVVPMVKQSKLKGLSELPLDHVNDNIGTDTNEVLKANPIIETRVQRSNAFNIDDHQDD